MKGKLRHVMALMSLMSMVSGFCLAGQWSITTVNNMPNLPSPFSMKDWYQNGRDYVAWQFNMARPYNATYYLPTCWWINSTEVNTNLGGTGFGMVSYVGMNGQYNVWGNACEAIPVMGSVLTGALMDYNMQNYNGYNFVNGCNQFYNAYTGENMFLNNIATCSGNSFWYDLTPGIIASGLLSLYPSENALANNFYSTADRWYNASYYMHNMNNYWYLGYDCKNLNPTTGGHVEPDGAAGIAYIELMAYKKWGTQHHWNGAQWAMDWLNAQTTNVNYELLIPFAAYCSARMNREHGTNYDTAKFINWSFDPSGVRTGWGAITGRWGSEDCYGLIGSRLDFGGYAFQMNTQIYAWPLAALVRYDNRFARAVGKWMLNAANASRLMYGNHISSTYQSCYSWVSAQTYAMSYEGLAKTYNNRSPYAFGDGTRLGWAPVDVGPYPSCMSGVFGGLIRNTNNTQVLLIDTCRTDFMPPSRYSTYLYYNPHASSVWINLNLPAGTWHLWDGVTNSWKRTSVSGLTNFSIGANTSSTANCAAVVSVIPASATIAYPVVNGKTRLTANDVVVDFDVYD